MHIHLPFERYILTFEINRILNVVLGFQTLYQSIIYNKRFTPN